MSNRRDHFRVKSLKALADARLRLAFRDGLTVEVDLKPWIKASKSLRPLAESALFATARLASGGRVVEFGDGAIDLATDNLRNLATEQASGIGHERLWNWMHANELTVAQAAEALGLSPRMLIYYRNGEKPIPRHVWLACVGWETLNKHDVAA
jgi:hypothetical protein